MFVEFEGIAGSGKTTLSRRIAERLSAQGRAVCQARAGGRDAPLVAERIRDLTHGVRGLWLCGSAELLLCAALEAQTVEELIRPALARGQWVIADGRFHSQLALACHGCGELSAQLDQLTQLAGGGLRPDLSVLVDTEPFIATARKKCQQIREHEHSAPNGRAGQAGGGMPSCMRRGFLTLARAEPGRWLIFENTWAKLEEAEDHLVQAVLARAEGRPLPHRVAAAPGFLPVSAAGGFQEARALLMAAIDGLASREPPLAAFLLSGLSGPDADERRLRLMRAEPAIVAHGLKGVPGEGAMALRHALKAGEPGYVARSVTGLADEGAFALRAELAARVPGDVARSLKGLFGPEAFSLRHDLSATSPGDVLASLAGLDNADAWALRDGLSDRSSAEDLAKSLEGLESEGAWQLRLRLLERAPLAVIRSLAALTSQRSHDLRSRFLACAPLAVLQTLTGLSDETSWRLREEALAGMCEAVLSVGGLDNDRAWALRERAASIWPGAVARSLTGLSDLPRSQALLRELLTGHPSDLELLQSAALASDPSVRLGSRSAYERAQVLDEGVGRSGMTIQSA